MKTKRQLIIVILLLLLSCTAAAQQGEGGTTAAVIAGEPITLEDFVTRFELTPHTELHANPDSAKIKFLYTIAAEKLWAAEAEALGYDSSAYVQQEVANIEKMYVRDYLHKVEVENKVRIKPDDLNTGLQRYPYNLKLNFLFAPGEAESKRLHEQLLAGAPFDSLLQSRPEAAQQLEPVEVRYGQMQPELEDIVYSLAPGSFSAPVQTPDGWTIFFLKEQFVSPEYLKVRQEDVPEKVKTIISDRQKDSLYADFTRRFYEGIEVTANREAFNKLVAALLDEAQGSDAPGDSLWLTAGEIRTASAQIPRELATMPLIEFDRNPDDAAAFLAFLAFDDFSWNSASGISLPQKINAAIREYIRLELLVREGYERGYQNLPEVREAVAMWRESYLASLYRVQFNDSARVTTEEAREYFDMNDGEVQSPAMVNIIEITSPDLGDIDRLLQRNAQGESFRQLAMEWYGADSAGVESGFFPAVERGELGAAAWQIAEGEVFGPVETKEGYALIEVVAKQEPGRQKFDTFAEAEPYARQELFYKRLFNALDESTARLAVKYGLQVNEQAVFNANVTKVPMIVYRHMGFGGRILAVPYNSSYHSWIQRYRELTSQTP